MNLEIRQQQRLCVQSTLRIYAVIQYANSTFSPELSGEHLLLNFCSTAAWLQCRPQTQVPLSTAVAPRTLPPSLDLPMVFLPYLSGIQIAFLDIKGGIQNVSLSLLLSVTASGMSHTCLYTPAATRHHRTLAGTHFASR